MQPNIQIGENARSEISDGLKRVLADIYTLQLKTQNYHWNVTGPQFAQLHEMFEAQYTELRDTADDVAERIRALGHRAPGSYAEFGALTAIKEEPGQPAAEGMVEALLKDNETLIATAKAAGKPAEESGDDSTFDMLNEVIFNAGKRSWMLRATLGG